MCAERACVPLDRREERRRRRHPCLTPGSRLGRRHAPRPSVCRPRSARRPDPGARHVSTRAGPQADPGRRTARRASPRTRPDAPPPRPATARPSESRAPPLPRHRPGRQPPEVPRSQGSRCERVDSVRSRNSPAGRPAARSGRPSPRPAEARALVSYLRGHAYEAGAGERRAPPFRDCGSLDRNRKRRACRQLRGRPAGGTEVIATVGPNALLSLWRGYADPERQVRPGPRFDATRGLVRGIARDAQFASRRCGRRVGRQTPADPLTGRSTA